MSASKVALITVPGAVWSDYLDPLASGMQAELGLPEPVMRKVGKGYQMRYHGVPVEVVRELADYLADRAYTLRGQDDDGMAHVHNAATSTAQRLRAMAERVSR